MWILTQLQQHFPHFFICNFFIAYHGHSVCDAAASHGKKQVTTIRRNQQRPVTSPAIFVEVLNTIDKDLAFSAQAFPTPRLKIKRSKVLTAGFLQFLYVWPSSSIEGMPTEFDISTHIPVDMPSLF